MKRTDDYSAKLEIWAENRAVYPLPRMYGLPKFKAVKFRSHEEMNRWKEALLAEIAAAGGVRWKK